MATRHELLSLGFPSAHANALGQTKKNTVLPTGTTQATAAPLLESATTLISALANKGVRLPQAVGQPIFVIYNNSGAAQNVYGTGTEQLNTLAGGSPFSLANGVVALCVPTGQGWYVSGFSADNPEPPTDTVTAAALTAPLETAIFTGADLLQFDSSTARLERLQMPEEWKISTPLNRTFLLAPYAGGYYHLKASDWSKPVVAALQGTIDTAVTIGIANLGFNKPCFITTNASTVRLDPGPFGLIAGFILPGHGTGDMVEFNGIDTVEVIRLTTFGFWLKTFSSKLDSGLPDSNSHFFQSASDGTYVYEGQIVDMAGSSALQINLPSAFNASTTYRTSVSKKQSGGSPPNGELYVFSESAGHFIIHNDGTNPVTARYTIQNMTRNAPTQMPVRISAVTRPVPDASILMGGQSLSSNTQHTDGAANMIQSIINGLSVALPKAPEQCHIDLVDVSFGGSYEVKSSALFAVPLSANWWYNPGGPTNTAATSATTLVSGTVLTFASTPAGISFGDSVADTTAPTAIPLTTYVLSFDATTVTLSAPISATVPVGSGDTIVFGPNGPLLTSAIAKINALVTKPTAIFWDGGQSDAIYASTVGLIGDPNVAANYRTALNAIFLALRTAINPGDPASIPIFLMPVGRTAVQQGGLFPGMEIIRQAQLVVVGAGTRIYDAMAQYDLAMPDNFHPEYDGEMAKYGTRVGDLIAQTSYAATGILLGPSVGTVTMGGPTRVDVPIVVEGGDTLYRPLTPWGPRIEDSAFPQVEVPITGYNWSGNTLFLTIAHPLTGSPMFYTIFDYGADFINVSGTTATSNYANTIMGTVSGKPLRYVAHPVWGA